MSHARDLLQMAEYHETLIDDRTKFLQSSLRGYPRQYYNLLTTQNQSWNAILAAFKEIYSSEVKREEMSVRLMQRWIENSLKKDEKAEDHAALVWFI